MRTVSFFTLGCKLNQAETASIARQFNNNDYKVVSFGERCDISVINTCTVTARTDYRCRQAIRKAKKISPDTKIVVVGCYAQTSMESLREMPEIDVILGSDRKFDIIDILNSANTSVAISENKEFRNIQSDTFSEQTRAFLKIQDGCDNYCSYCIIPYARGRSRSAQLEQIIKNAEQLVKKEYKEIVLTGVHIGNYGNDLKNGTRLINVLEELVKIPHLSRIRLSSLEPLEIDDELIDFVANSHKICNHFHIPLQHGDNFILKQMNRSYAIEQYNEVIEKIICKIPNAGIGTDVITGFPGEKEEHFMNTYDLISNLPLSYLHVFPFSSRPGTLAEKFTDIVPKQVKKERSAKLIALGKEKKMSFYEKSIGGNFKVLFEENTRAENWMYGFTENYIRIKAHKESDCFNQIVQVQPMEIHEKFVVGRILS